MEFHFVAELQKEKDMRKKKDEQKGKSYLENENKEAPKRKRTFKILLPQDQKR